jgi:cytochrome P450 family 4
MNFTIMTKYFPSLIDFIYYAVGPVVLLYCISVVAQRYYLWLTSPLRKIPGPPISSFLFGYALVILREPFLDPHKRWWSEYRKKHDGTSPPFLRYNNVFGSYSLCVLDPDSVKLVLTKPATRDPVRFPKNYFFLREILGNGLVTLEGSAWSRHRRLIQPSFHNFTFLKDALNKSVSERIERLVAAWKKASVDGRTIDVASHMSAITLDVIGNVAFSRDFGATKLLNNWATQSDTMEQNELMDTMDPLIQALRASMKVTFIAILLTALNLAWLEKFVNRKAFRTRALLNEAADDVIQKARDTRECSSSNDTKDSTIGTKSLLQLLFDASDTNVSEQSGIYGGRNKLSDIELRDEIKTFIMAGHETTSTWCYWAIYALAKYPDIQEKLYDHIAQHTKMSTDDTPITIEDADDIEYLSAFLQETLRLYSPVGLIFRYTSREERWHGYLIPKKTRILLPIHLLNRHPDYWSNPDDFVPDRWMNKDECVSRHKFCFIPFSAGGRNCVGQRFAEIEAKLIVANICQHFKVKFSPCMGDKDISFTHFVSMKSKPPIVIQVQHR